MQTAQRIEVIDALRGLAALSVAWFHFTNGGGLLSPGLLKTSGSYGWIGVEVFFVISGFVIPFSMSTGGYVLVRDGARFLARRLIRLEPPYLCSVVLCVGLTYLSSWIPGFRGPQPDYSLRQVLLHVGYLNAFFDLPWINVVYWSLAIEFQYYLMIALVFPAIGHPNAYARTASFLLLCAAPCYLNHDQFIGHWLGLFGMGIATWSYRMVSHRLGEYALFLVASCASVWFSLGAEVVMVALPATLLIAFARIPRIGALARLGAISYSLYLLHVPIGGRIINFANRFDPSAIRDGLALAGAVGLSLIAAQLWFMCLEKPSHALARRVTYGRVPPGAQPAGVTIEGQPARAIR